MIAQGRRVPASKVRQVLPEETTRGRGSRARRRPCRRRGRRRGGSGASGPARGGRFVGSRMPPAMRRRRRSARRWRRARLGGKAMRDATARCSRMAAGVTPSGTATRDAASQKRQRARDARAPGRRPHGGGRLPSSRPAGAGAGRYKGRIPHHPMRRPRPAHGAPRRCLVRCTRRPLGTACPSRRMPAWPHAGRANIRWRTTSLGTARRRRPALRTRRPRLSPGQPRPMPCGRNRRPVDSLARQPVSLVADGSLGMLDEGRRAPRPSLSKRRSKTRHGGPPRRAGLPNDSRRACAERRASPSRGP